MNTVTRHIEAAPHLVTRLLGICPSIIAIHEAMAQADKDIMNGVLEFNATYNKYVVNGHKPDSEEEYLEEVLNGLDFDEAVKEAYWRSCWYYASWGFHFRYPSRLQVAAMMLRG